MLQSIGRGKLKCEKIEEMFEKKKAKKLYSGTFAFLNRILDTEFEHNFCCFTDVFRAVQFTGHQHLACSFNYISIINRLLLCLLE